MTRLLTICTAVSFVLFSCGTGQTNNSQESEEGAVSAEDLQIIADMHVAIRDMHRPTLLPHLLQETGSVYDGSLVNGFERVTQYEHNDDTAAMNLGVYATDLGYQVAFGQIDEALSHMDAIEHLAKTVGVQTAFDHELMDIWQAQPDSHDSISDLLNKTPLLEESSLDHSERLNMAALALTGSFIEGLYLAAKKIDDHDVEGMSDSEKDLKLQPLMQILLEQEQPLKDIIKLMKDLPDDETILRMINELEILVLLYDSDLENIEKAMKGQEDFLLTPDLLIDVVLSIENIREKIVS